MVIEWFTAKTIAVVAAAVVIISFVVVCASLLIYMLLCKCCKCICYPDVEAGIGLVPTTESRPVPYFEPYHTPYIEPLRVPEHRQLPYFESNQVSYFQTHKEPSISTIATHSTSTRLSRTINPDRLSSVKLESEISYPRCLPHHRMSGTVKTSVASPTVPSDTNKATMSTAANFPSSCFGVFKVNITNIHGDNGFNLFHSCSENASTLTMRQGGINTPEIKTISYPRRLPNHLTIGSIKTSVVPPPLPPLADKATPSTATTSPCSCSGVIKGEVTHVHDGDGFDLAHSCSGGATLASTLKIRLAGIDAPEMKTKNTEGQPNSKESKDYLKKLILGKTLYLEKYRLDQYGRTLAMAYLPSSENTTDETDMVFSKNVNLVMLAQGWAWVYIGNDAEYGKYEHAFRKAEAKAKSLRIGIWVDGTNIESPMDYKRRLRALQFQPIIAA